jgi:(2R)-ethylmalonyl-CoA mutase
MEVVYEGIRLTPQDIVDAAIKSKAHVVGLSILSGSHLDLVQETVRLMRNAGLLDVPVVVGGIIPAADELVLKQMGVAAVYTPKDFQITEIMGDIVRIVEQKALAPA